MQLGDGSQDFNPKNLPLVPVLITHPSDNK